VIDWGAMGVGDPACDLMVAWKLHSAAGRDRFRKRLGPRTTQPGSGHGVGFCRRRSRYSPTTPRRTTRPCTTKRRAGSTRSCQTVTSANRRKGRDCSRTRRRRISVIRRR
jgi:hypothetical protein